MTRLSTSILALAMSVSIGWMTPEASAQPLHAEPGSVLIFPLFDSTAGNNTLLTVTNINEDERVCLPFNGFRKGDIQLHYVYFSDVWAQSDTDENLTPADTLTVLARGHNPNQENGFLVVEARDPETNFPSTFNYLLGSAIVVNSEFDFQWSYTPYAFESLGRGGAPCQNILEQPGDPTFDTLDFDGIEYSAFPSTLYLDHFFGEGEARPGVTFSNMLYLLSTDPGGPLPEEMTNVDVQGYNNNERGFSRSFRFNCYTVTTLNDITNAASQAALATDGNPDELGGISSGWLRMSTRNSTGHGLLGVFAHMADINGNSFVAGRELQYTGTRQVSLPRGF